MNTPSSAQLEESRQIAAAQAALERAGRLHWFHWLVVVLSLLLTLLAWHFSKSQLDDKIQSRFERESEQVVQLIAERLQKYEDALWGAVATLHAYGDNMDFRDWQTFARALHLDEKYKGINGLGIIHRVPLENKSAYLAWQRQQRPDFDIHPPLQQDLLLPISYIVPVAGNEAAVGLDIAHENNRYSAALKARDSGQAQITGPIVLVQDAEHTPGFLFYAPFYTNDENATLEQRQHNFVGLIYAPFVVHKLMQGTLEKARRQVEFSIRDGDQYIYDEGENNRASSRGNAALNLQRSLPIYGRNWVVDIWSTRDFYNETTTGQPQLILFGGITIDLMLLTLFLLMSRANRRSLRFAGQMSRSYQQRSRELQITVDRLESSNQELEQFAYIASHDLQEPLRTLSNYTGLLKERLGDHEDEQCRMAANFIDKAAQRMRQLVLGLMSYNRIGAAPELQEVDCNKLIEDVCSDLAAQLRDAGSEISYSDLPLVQAFPDELRLLFQNLISNAVKFRKANNTNHICIRCHDEGIQWHFEVQDNGIGINEANFERIFQVFRRLHRDEVISGSGIGLASCKKVVQMHGGRIWVSSREGIGSSFHFTLPKEPVYEKEI